MAMQERNAFSGNGWLALLLGLGMIGGSIVLFVMGAEVAKRGGSPALPIGEGVGLTIAGLIVLTGCVVVGPNEARVLTFAGRYVGTIKESGLRWANPFTSKTQISLRARNFETSTIKVNDVDGNPIEIGAVITWRVTDTAQASFDVENFGSFVQKQSEAAVRNLAMHHPYDTHDETQISLRGQSEAVAEQLRKEVDERIRTAGVRVVDARIAHLSYAPEIAQAMLQRQQAGAIIAARTRIVEGAVSMVEMALDQLAKRGIIELDQERKAAMVSNLLVVLCGERATQPIINTGSLY
ncbi:MAG TPA: SPFH domain-containing protein [Kofleriaceae bacterium]|jgi:regulator of protease activity HflC (stomatin/prohibitin superfamily)